MKILVTGAGGHLGYNIIDSMLAAGHHVRGSLRSLDDAVAMTRLRRLGDVELVAAPLDDGARIRSALEGIEALVHTAAVYLLHAPGREAEIVSTSVDGVERVLRAAKDAGVRRVVLTSSVVSLPPKRRGEAPADENDWAVDLRVPYFRAKTLAEQRAWELARELKLDLVSILPGPFGGPGFVRNTPTIDVLVGIKRGVMRLAAPPVAYPYVDVRDVALAHRMALESGADGRFIAINEPIPTLGDIARELAAIDSAIPRPLMDLPAATMSFLPLLERVASWLSDTPRTMTPEMAATLNGRVLNVTSARIRRELGWEPRYSLRQSLIDTMAELRQREAADAARARDVAQERAA